MRIQKEVSRCKNEALIGQVHPVLVGEMDDDYLLTGRFAFQAPDIDGQAIIEETEAEPGQILDMRITGSMEYDLIARGEDQAVKG